MQIDEALVDAHLVSIPGLGTLSTGSFPGGNSQNLSGHAHWSLHLQGLLLSSLDKISTHCRKKKYFI